MQMSWDCTHITLEKSSLVTGIKDTGRTELNHRGTARLDSRDAHGSCGISIVQLPSFNVTTMLETYAIDPVIKKKMIGKHVR